MTLKDGQFKKEKKKRGKMGEKRKLEEREKKKIQGKEKGKRQSTGFGILLIPSMSSLRLSCPYQVGLWRGKRDHGVLKNTIYRTTSDSQDESSRIISRRQ